MKRLTFPLAFLAIAALACNAGVEQPQTETAPPAAPLEAETQTENAPSAALTPLDITGKYLLSFHACETAECMQGPMNHMVYLAQSDDGANWNLVPGWQPYRGSVPDVIRRGNVIYIFTPGQVARYDLDTQAFEGPVPVNVNGLEAGYVDPSLIVDDQGRLVMFFLYGRMGSDPASCPADTPTCDQRFGSATEVEGSDGAQFTLDGGDRASVVIAEDSSSRSASDPDIFFDGSQYILYLSHGPSVSVWTSADLRGSYAQLASLPGGMLSQGSGGIASGYFDSASGTYWTFAHAPSPNSAAKILFASHADFSRQIGASDWAVALSGESLGLGASVNVESPGFAINTP